MDKVFRSPEEQERLVAAYILHKNLQTQSLDKKREIARELDFHKAEEYFGRFTELNCFEFLCWYLLSEKKPYANINDAFRKAEIPGCELTSDVLKKQCPYNSAQASYESLINFEYAQPKTWKPLFDSISKSAQSSWRYISHFLLPYPKFKELSSKQNHNDSDVTKLRQFLEGWMICTLPEFHEWWLLKSVLLYVGETQTIKEIEEEYKKKLKSRVSDCVVSAEGIIKTFIIDFNTDTSERQMLLYNARTTIPHGDHVYIKESGLAQLNKTPKTDYQKKCLQYIDLFKWRVNGQPTTSEQFPPEHAMITETSEIAKCFKRLFVDDVCFIITHYNSEEHLNLLQYPKEEVCRKLDIDAIADYKERFLYFNFTKNIIMNVRLCDKSSDGDVDFALHASLDDLILFLFLNFDILLDANTKYVPCVCAPKVCTSNNKFLFSKDNLNKSKLRGKIRSFLKKEQEADSKVFQMIIASVIGVLAVRSEDSCVPHLYGSSSSRVMFIRFTAEQLRILYSQCKLMIIKGGNGSGKSLIGWYLAKLLAESASEPTVLYYICFDNNTMLCQTMLQNAEKLSNKLVQIISGYASEIFASLSKDSSVSLTVSSLLQAIDDNHKEDNKSYHVIIDELDCEMINTIQANALRELFENASVKLREAYVVFLARALEKKVAYVEGTTSCQHNSYRCYSDEKCGMVVEELSYCMRMSQQCFDVVNIAATVIMEKESVINHPKSQSPVNLNLSVITEPLAPVSPEDVSLDFRPNFVRSTSTATSLHHDAESDLDFQTSHKESVLSGLSPVNSDELFSLAKKMKPDQMNQDVRTETRFDFNMSKETGHSVQGSKAKLIFLFDEGESYCIKAAAGRLSVVLELYCFHHVCFTEKALMVCSSEEIGLFVSAMKLIEEPYAAFYPGRKLEFDTLVGLKERIINNQGNNFITTVAGCRGMEYPWVIASINPNDYFERQHFVEAISRCTGQLILVVPYTFQEGAASERASMYDVLQKLKEARTGDGQTLLDVVHFRFDSDKELLHLNDKTALNRNFHEVIEYTRQAKKMFFAGGEELHKEAKDTSEIFMGYSRPSKVEGVSCYYISRNQCMLTWKGDPYQYLVYKRSLNNPDNTDEDKLEDVKQIDGRCMCMIAGLDPQTTYEFKITCSNLCGLQSEPCLVEYIPRKLINVSHGYDGRVTLKIMWNKETEVVKSLQLDGEDILEVAIQQIIKAYLHMVISDVTLHEKHVIRVELSDNSGSSYVDSLQIGEDRAQGISSIGSTDGNITHNPAQDLQQPIAYRMENIPRGLCVIFSNDFIENHPRRHGANIDVESLRNAFESLHFVVEVYTNLTMSEMTDVLHAVTSRDHRSFDCFIACLLSHGYEGGIFTRDNQQFSIANLVSYFHVDHFPTMASKPKLIFVQACQGDLFDNGGGESSETPSRLVYESHPVYDSRQVYESDGISHSFPKDVSVSLVADIFVFVAAAPGFVAWRNSTQGSWFIQALCNVLQESGESWSLDDIVLRVNQLIAEMEGNRAGNGYEAKQISNVMFNTLRKKLYFKQKHV